MTTTTEWADPNSPLGAFPANSSGARIGYARVSTKSGVSRTTLYKYVPELATGRDSLVVGSPSALPSVKATGRAAA
ncbi:hypothetical protein GCM10010423_70070 [Streptomyces levis]|uniref:Resolvase/invertase-type recombinase catalytic domain-containing protein n=1 Tax=Streptomyces levis TaxID=285566 RepID=A0ABP6BGR7_9ACTN